MFSLAAGTLSVQCSWSSSGSCRVGAEEQPVPAKSLPVPARPHQFASVTARYALGAAQRPCTLAQCEASLALRMPPVFQRRGRLLYT